MVCRATVTAICLGSLGAFAGAILNGGFEDPVTADFTYLYGAPPPGWSGSGGPPNVFEVQRRYTAHGGQQYYEGDADGSGRYLLFQAVNTDPGLLTEVSFYTSPRPGHYDNALNFFLIVDGVKIVDVSLTADGSGLRDTSWTGHSYQFTSGKAYSVNFVETGGVDSLGMFLDDVKGTPTPEPGSALLVVAAGAALVLIRKRS